MHANFASYKYGVPFFAIYEAKHASEKVDGYVIPSNSESSDTLSADFDAVYNNWLEAGVEFIGKKVLSGKGFVFNIAYFRDTEGNLLR